MTTQPPSDGGVATEVDDRLQRALADLDNLRKRFDREVRRERYDERARVAAEWLPVIDNLELALQHGQDAEAGLMQGVRAVRDQALGILVRLGFPRFEDVGEPSIRNGMKPSALSRVTPRPERSCLPFGRATARTIPSCGPRP